MQVKNIVVGQKYTDKQGTEKTKWTTIGVAFIKDDGKMSGRIDMQPLNWDGNFVLFDRDENKQRPSQQTSQYKAQPAPVGSFPVVDDATDLPF